jgi:GPI-anchor transamidase subunit T
VPAYEDGLTRIATYAPPTDHKPTLLECIVTIPPLSTIQLTVAVEKASIAYTEHPPDASRGWDLPPAVIQPLDHHGPQRIYTSTLLGDLPTPDFSMPYNVIIMTCTLVALFFGSIFNILIRSFIWVEVEGDDDAQNPVKQKTE